MTGSNTDKVETAPYMQGAAILLRIASPLFRAWMKPGPADPLDPYYNAWFMLRRIAAAFLERRHTKLARADREGLIAALKVAHDLAHDLDLDGIPPVDVCHCDVSEDICALVALMASDAQRAEAA